MEERVDEELQRVLEWAKAARSGADRQGAPVDKSCFGYVGGVLTTLQHLGHVSPTEADEWQRRLLGVLGQPPSGFVHIA